MNPLTLLPLLAVAMAAPGAQYYYTQPALQYQSVQVPLTKTVHYENRPVVTGYQTTIHKPSLVSAPVLSGLSPALTYLQEIPAIPDAPGIPNNTAPAPPSDFPTPAPGPPADLPTPAPLPGVPGQMPPPENNGTGSDQGGSLVPVPGSPIIVGTPTLYNNNYLSYNPYLNVAPLAHSVQAVRPATDAVVIDARSVPVVSVRAAQAGDYEPLVTKERVLAPVRTHTQITPQVTQIQPEVTYRRVIQDVPVHTPVAVQQQVYQQQVIPQNFLSGHNIINGARLVL